ncbi:NAD-P-binding protein [Earliella scabrosa]|nr:NAD-P-binding protein [Earliella scabrosa]
MTASVLDGTTWFITGANRGIGLETTRQLLESLTTTTIVATARNPSQATALNALANRFSGRLHVVALEVADQESVRKCAQEVASIVGEQGIDYLINNAGTNPGVGDTAYAMIMADLQAVFMTHVAGPAYIAQLLLPLVEKSRRKTIVNITSSVGSIGSDFGAINASYSISKAALNMLTTKQAKERPDVVSISMCPGWLKTDLGGEGALLDVSIGVAGVIKTISSLTPESNGKFYNFEGKQVPW